jgi:pyruvate dehydrogenase E1 component alpha subunit
MFAVLARYVKEVAQRSWRASTSTSTLTAGGPADRSDRAAVPPEPDIAAPLGGDGPRPEPQPGDATPEELDHMSQVETEAKPIVTRNQALGWLRQMMLIRRFEERAEMMYQKGRIGGFFHQYSGQEPVAIGSIGVLREDDYVITAYRDHGHALARGMETKMAMAELLGKATGCSKGKGGSMHFFDAEKGFLGGHAIVGSHIPLATGVGFAIKYRGEDRVCICYFGDGAMNQGSFHEALNMAALWKLPVIYVVENNMYAMGTSLSRSTAVKDLTARGGTAYGIPGVSINGNDIELMAQTTREAADRARSGEGPTFIEAQTYRFKGHSISDPAKYRLKDELDEAHKNDPIHIYETVLRERGWIDDATVDRFRDEVRKEVDESIEFAEQSEETPLGSLYEDVTVAPFIPQE